MPVGDGESVVRCMGAVGGLEGEGSVLSRGLGFKGVVESDMVVAVQVVKFNKHTSAAAYGLRSSPTSLHSVILSTIDVRDEEATRGMLLLRHIHSTSLHLVLWNCFLPLSLIYCLLHPLLF